MFQNCVVYIIIRKLKQTIKRKEKKNKRNKQNEINEIDADNQPP